jgi:hypothetical protein
MQSDDDIFEVPASRIVALEAALQDRVTAYALAEDEGHVVLLRVERNPEAALVGEVMQEVDVPALLDLMQSAPERPLIPAEVAGTIGPVSWPELAGEIRGRRSSLFELTHRMLNQSERQDVRQRLASMMSMAARPPTGAARDRSAKKPLRAPEACNREIPG